MDKQVVRQSLDRLYGELTEYLQGKRASRIAGSGQEAPEPKSARLLRLAVQSIDKADQLITLSLRLQCYGR
jgi:hypothetical protein